MKQLTAESPEELDTVAEEVVSALDGRTVVALYGTMGAGKTTLVSRIAV